MKLSTRAQWLLAGNPETSAEGDKWINQFGMPLIGVDYLVTHHEYGSQLLHQTVARYKYDRDPALAGWVSTGEPENQHWVTRVVSWRLLVGELGTVEGPADGLLIEPRDSKRAGMDAADVLPIPRSWMTMSFAMQEEDEEEVRRLIAQYQLNIERVVSRSEGNVALDILFHSVREASIFMIAYRQVMDKREAMRRGELDLTRTCRGCGCTADDCSQCWERTGKACHWVEQDLCSACASKRTDRTFEVTVQLPDYISDTTYQALVNRLDSESEGAAEFVRHGTLKDKLTIGASDVPTIAQLSTLFGNIEEHLRMGNLSTEDLAAGFPLLGGGRRYWSQKDLDDDAREEGRVGG